jgi:alkanesulfonate monooxygenase SsuD/methylene tetrahydromethanopterin reductase-like flavin-dependent oxidoreductase (luciferase family)
MLRAAGAIFDGWLPLTSSPAGYASELRSVREAAERAGRDPADVATGVYLTLAVADSPSAAAGKLDSYMRAYYGVPAVMMSSAMALHSGTPESAGEWIAAYRDAGARHVVLRVAHPGLGDYNDVARQLLSIARSPA